MPLPAGALPPQPVEIETVRGAVTRLSLLAQALAGATEGDPEHYAEAFADSLQHTLSADVSPITLSLRDGVLHYAGSEVSGNDLVTHGLLRSLQDEGLAAVTLLPGVGREELLELSHLLARPRGEGERNYIDAEGWKVRFQRVHLECAPLRLVTEADEQVRPVELVRRLFAQLGVSEDTLGDGMSVELMSLLGGLRALADSPAARRVGAPGTGSVWSRALREVRYARDVPDELVGMLTMESLRAAPDAAACTALADRWVGHIRAAMADGNPLLAAQILRRMLICVDPDYRPHRLDGAPIQLALGRLCNAETRAALDAGLRRHPQTDDWAGLLFSLAGTVSADGLLGIAELGANLPPGPLREALGDGLALAIDRAEQRPRELLSSASDTALPVVLQALGRFDDATLVEPLLARVRHGEADVREAALRALRAHHTPRIGIVAGEATTDKARSVRLEALRYLSVYRIVDAAAAIETRLRKVQASEVDGDEVRALAIALLHTSRGAALPALESIVADPRSYAHPEVPQAGIAALSSAGAPGRAALDRLGRAHEHLRPLLRAPLGNHKPGRKPEVSA